MQDTLMYFPFTMRSVSSWVFFMWLLRQGHSMQFELSCRDPVAFASQVSELHSIGASACTPSSHKLRSTWIVQVTFSEQVNNVNKLVHVSTYFKHDSEVKRACQKALAHSQHSLAAYSFLYKVEALWPFPKLFCHVCWCQACLNHV